MAKVPATGAEDRHPTSRRPIPIDLEVLPSVPVTGRPYLPRISAVWVTFDADGRAMKTGQTINVYRRWNTWYGAGPRVARIGWQECPADELERMAHVIRSAARRWNIARRSTFANGRAKSGPSSVVGEPLGHAAAYGGDEVMDAEGA